MRRVALALVVALVPACGLLSPQGSGGAGAGGGGAAGSGGGGAGGGGGMVADAHAQHNLDVLNLYRAQAGVAALTYDTQLSTFSTTASTMLESSGQAHGYFVAQSNSGAIWSQGFCGSAAENQAPGWPTNGDIDATIDGILKAMMNEGPGGGHHDNILAASSTRVGVGLVVDAQGALWFTNDFSGRCQ